jgi:DNA transformation protein
MGQKGDKLTKESTLSAELFVEKLSSINGISSRKMFGGHGIFHNNKMFGIVDSKGKYFLKADDSNKAMFEANNADKHSKMPYYSIPDEVMNNQEKLIEWVKKSINTIIDK